MMLAQRGDFNTAEFQSDPLPGAGPPRWVPQTSRKLIVGRIVRQRICHT